MRLGGVDYGARSNAPSTILLRAVVLREPRNVAHEDIPGRTDRVRNDKTLRQPAVFFTAQPADDYIISGIP